MLSKYITILNLPVEPYIAIEDLQHVLKNLPFDFNISMLDVSYAYHEVVELINYSDLLIIPISNCFKYYNNDIVDIVLKYFESGGNIWYQVDPNPSSLQRNILERFGMVDSSVKLRPAFGYDVPFIKSPQSFRDRHLFKNIDQITITQPRHIECKGDAEPILVSDGTFLSIDSQTDLFSKLESNKIISVALYEGPLQNAFLCINGFISIPVSDEERLLSDNEKFLNNIYSHLFTKRSRMEIAQNIVSTIEINLNQFVINRLKTFYGNRYEDKIPEFVKNQAIPSTNDPIENRLFFKNLKHIIKYNKTIFVECFSDNVNDVLVWLDEVAEIRNGVSHPLKYSSNNSLGFDKIQVLLRFDSLRNIVE